MGAIILGPQLIAGAMELYKRAPGWLERGKQWFQDKWSETTHGVGRMDTGGGALGIYDGLNETIGSGGLNPGTAPVYLANKAMIAGIRSLMSDASIADMDASSRAAQNIGEAGMLATGLSGLARGVGRAALGRAGRLFGARTGRALGQMIDDAGIGAIRGAEGGLARGGVSGLTTEAGVVRAINHNADVATELARRALARGRISAGPQAFGTRAHKYFEGLNNRLNRRLAESGSDFRIRAEVFRDGRLDPITGQFLDVARRGRGAVGPDVLMESVRNPNFVRVFDLKTYGRVQYPISKGRQTLFGEWFGGHAEEIFRAR